MTEHDPSYPYGEFDAHKWAEEFDRIFPDKRPDTDTMMGWFANAIMTGYDSSINKRNDAFVYCPYCGRRLAVVYWAHVCGLADID